ncbi:hypothetical protein LCGC14_2598970 [marine sediment metagenome]|uniref:Uncharacterized protein n=1 Tax=marine sediment metagenome TaxID=412755 RepID=A0A0F9D201_9ZZZZ
MATGKDFLMDHHIVSAFEVKADAFLGGIDTDSVSLRDYDQATLVIFTGAIEDAAISNLVTFKASTDNAQAGATAMAWHRRDSLSSSTVDAWGDLTAVAAAGFNFADVVATGVANAIWYGSVTAAEVQAALADAEFVHATIDETVDKTITAGGLWILSKARYPGMTPKTAIV